jgi:hypothetical protein
LGVSLSELLARPARIEVLRVDVVLRELSKPDAAALVKALNDPSITAGRITTALAELGVTCSRSAIIRWRQSNAGKTSDAR